MPTNGSAHVQRLSIFLNTTIKRKIKIRFLCGVGQKFWIEAVAVDFGNGFRNPAFSLCSDSLAFGFYGTFITRPDMLIHIFILRNTVLPFCGQGGFAFDEVIVVPLGLLKIGSKGLHALVVITFGPGKDIKWRSSVWRSSVFCGSIIHKEEI